jgi:two-component system alkaline phosphatase synthesis response regulator PhoP
MRLAFAISRSLAAVSEPHPAAAPVAAGSPAQPRTAVTRPSVVLADDDGIVLALVKSTLQNYGMSCRSVDNGRDALRLIRSEQPHVAVLDVNMPGMDGYEVLAAVRAEKLPTRLILLTSLQQEKDILRAFNLGADDYLTKPFNPFELVARLKRLVQ